MLLSAENNTVKIIPVEVGSGVIPKSPMRPRSSKRGLNLLIGHDDIVTSSNYSYDGKKIISSSSDKTIKIWDSKTEKCLYTL